TSNPNLRPEKSKTYDLGLMSKGQNGRAGVHVFRTYVTDLIAPDSNFVPQNLNRARIDGLETEVGATLDDWRLNGAFTWLDPRDGRKPVRQGLSDDCELQYAGPQLLCHLGLRAASLTSRVF